MLALLHDAFLPRIASGSCISESRILVARWCISDPLERPRVLQHTTMPLSFRTSMKQWNFHLPKGDQLQDFDQIWSLHPTDDTDVS